MMRRTVAIDTTTERNRKLSIKHTFCMFFLEARRYKKSAAHSDIQIFAYYLNYANRWTQAKCASDILIVLVFCLRFK